MWRVLNSRQGSSNRRALTRPETRFAWLGRPKKPLEGLWVASQTNLVCQAFFERNLVHRHLFAEKLANTERHLDVSKTHTLRAEDQIDELKKLNRSIFRPAITFNKDAKRAAQEAKIQERYEDERREREKAMMDIRDTQNRLGQAATYGGQQPEDEGIQTGFGNAKFRTAEQLAGRKEQRKRYQFEAGGSDDELEDELDDNLDEVSKVTKSLKALATAMGQEVDAQNDRLDVIGNKATSLDNNVFRQTERVRWPSSFHHGINTFSSSRRLSRLSLRVSAVLHFRLGKPRYLSVN